MSLPWYRCYPRDFNEGMDGLTLEERGAYITLLNLIYARGAPIPEDQWWITSKLGCTSRTWTKIRAALVVKRKLYVLEQDGEPHLMNARAAAEIEARQEVCKKFSDGGKRGGRNAQAKRKENNGGSQARLKPSSSLAQAITDTDTEGSVAPSNDEATGAEAPQVDLTKKAWDAAKGVLVGQAAMTLAQAGKVFGKILADNGVEARDLLGAIAEAENLRTSDPVGYLTRAAQARGRRKQTGPPRRVSYV